MRAPIIALGLVLLGLVLAAPVRAQSGTSPRERAVALFAQSVTAYREGRFEEAADLLDEAYRLQPEPILLYNLGRAREGAGDDDAAADAYRRYLRTDGTDDTDASAARARLAVLDRRIEERHALEARAAEREAEAAATQTRPDTPVATPAAASRSIAIAPWVIAGGGALVLGVGAVLGGLMLERSSAAQAAPIQADAVAAQSQAETYAIAADVLYGVGALAALVGVIWGIVDLTSAPPEQPRVSLRVGPASLALEATW